MNKTLTIELEMPMRERKRVQIYQIGDGHACGKDAVTHMRIGTSTVRASDADHAELSFWTTEVQDFGPATLRVVNGVVAITTDDPNYGLAKIPTTLGDVRALGAGHVFEFTDHNTTYVTTDFRHDETRAYVSGFGDLFNPSPFADSRPITYLGRAKREVVK